MKLPVSMLRDFVSTLLTAEEIGDLLTMAGFELEDLLEVEGEPVLDLKVMANRGDGLSAFGLSREILAKDADSTPTELYLAAAARFPSNTVLDKPGLVKLESAACTRYACRLFSAVENGPSPEWLAQRLRQAGQRPISLLVDLTNYVLLELGQPLHAFDMDTLTGGRIVVREARLGEKITTLNGDEHELQPHHLVICDSEKPVAVAGVMGGQATEVGPTTKTMLLESAHFVNSSVRKTRKELGLNTEASYRFERSVDPDGVVAALQRFAILYHACRSGSVPGTSLVEGGYGIEPGVLDVYPAPPVTKEIGVRASRASMLLGMEIAPSQVQDYLSRLGMTVQAEGDKLLVTAPSWRPDIVREEDLVEEVGRVHGYDRIPEEAPSGHTPRGGVFGIPALIDHARETALRCGYNQIISHTLRDKHPLDFSLDWRIGPRNPHSPEMALMRDSLLPGLAEAALRNGGRDLHLFEIGRVFLRGEYQIDESPELSILSTGKLYPAHWSGKDAAEADFYSVKGAVEAIAATLHVEITFDHPRNPDRRFHPTRQAGVLVDEGRLWVGTVGQIHPDVAEEVGLPERTFMTELDLLVFAVQKRYEPSLRIMSRNPSMQRDISVLMPVTVPYATLEAAIKVACGEDLERVWLFDVYTGKGIPDGHHSLAIAMQLRRVGENLNDEAANGIRDRAIAAVNDLGGVLR